MPIATCTHGHVLPGAVPVHARYGAPRSSSIKIAYKPKPETLSEQIVRLMSSRPREKVSLKQHLLYTHQGIRLTIPQIVVYKSKPSSYGYGYDDGSYPVVINNVSGKRGRGLPRDQVGRLERRFSSTEHPVIINNRVHGNKRHLYERERRLPPPPAVFVGPETYPYRTVSVSPGPGYTPAPARPRSHSYSRPSVHFADEVYAPSGPPGYSRPRVHFSDDIFAPNIIEVTHADDE